MAQFGLLGGTTTKKATDPLKSIGKQNAASRALLESIGEKDPTKDKGPSALERIFGILDTPGAGVRSLAYNAVSDTNVNPLKEMWKSLKGEQRVEGADILDEMGVKNTWAKFLGGLAVDILLDPLTYLSFGYSGAAKASGKSLVEKVVQHGDDVASIATDLGKNADDVERLVRPLVDKYSQYFDDIAKMPVEASRGLMDDAVRSFDKGGVKFLGQSLGGQDTLTKMAYGTKDLLRGKKGPRALREAIDPISKWIEQAFIHGEMTPAYRQGNEVLNAWMDMKKRGLSAGMNQADEFGHAIFQRLSKDIPDEKLRSSLSVAMSNQLDDEALAKIGQAWGAVKNAATDDEAATALETVNRLRQELFDPAAIGRTLKGLGFNDEEIKAAEGMATNLQQMFSESLGKRKAAGLDAKDFMGDDSAFYLPGMGAMPRTKSGEKARQGIMSELGFDGLRTQDPSSFRFSSKAVPQAQGAKEYSDPLRRMQGVTLDDLFKFGGDEGPTRGISNAVGGLDTELDVARSASTKLTKDARDLVFKQYQDDITKVLGDNDDVKNLIAKTQSFFTDDEATRGFLKTFDKAQNAWKKMATIWNPGFHARNKLSNAYLLWSEDIFDPDSWAKAIPYLAGKSDDTVVKLGSFEGTVKQLVDLAKSKRVVVGKFESAELVGKEATEGLLTKAGGWVGEHLVEDADRLSGFMAALKKGLDPDASALLVDRAMYNYAPEGLQVFERNVLKRLTPFYTWMRRNTPHMVELFAKDPSKVAWLGHLQQTGEATVDYDKSVKPDWMRDLFPIATPLKSKEGSPLFLNPNFPIQDIEKLNLVRDGQLDFKDAFGSLSPLIKLPFEILIAKKDVYFGDNLTGVSKRAPGYVEAFDDVVSGTFLDPVWAELKSVMDINEREKDGEAYLVMPDYAVKMLRDISPWLNNIGKVLTSRERQPYDVMSNLTGIKMMPYNESDLAGQKVYSDRAKLQEALGILKSQGVDTSTSKPKGKTLSDLLGVK